MKELLAGVITLLVIAVAILGWQVVELHQDIDTLQAEIQDNRLYIESATIPTPDNITTPTPDNITITIPTP